MSGGMNRRWFLGASLAAVGSVLVPKYGGWYRQGSGVLVPQAVVVPEPPVLVSQVPLSVWQEMCFGESDASLRRWLNSPAARPFLVRNPHAVQAHRP